MKTILMMTLLMLTACGTGKNTGERGDSGPPGQVIYGPGTGVGELVTECEYTWGHSESFNYWNHYLVRKLKNGDRLVLLCTTQK